MPLNDYPNLTGDLATLIAMDVAEGIDPRDSTRVEYGHEELLFRRDMLKEFAFREKKEGHSIVIDVKE